MATIRFLKNAPIQEAILDIHVSLPPNTQVAVPQSIKDQIQLLYPKASEISNFEVSSQIQMGGKEENASINKRILPNGYLFASADGKDLLQFRFDGFSINRLHPYPGWDPLIDKARKHWDLYRQSGKPASIVRLSARFINNIALPEGLHHWKNSLTGLSNNALGETGIIEQSLSRNLYSDHVSGLKATVTQVFGKQPDQQHESLLLDIDVFKQGQWEPESQEIWEVLKKIRDLKNRLFFNILEDDLVGRFE